MTTPLNETPYLNRVPSTVTVYSLDFVQISFAIRLFPTHFQHISTSVQANYGYAQPLRRLRFSETEIT